MHALWEGIRKPLIAAFLCAYFLLFAAVQSRPLMEPLRGYWNHPLFPRLHTMIFIQAPSYRADYFAKVTHLSGKVESRGISPGRNPLHQSVQGLHARFFLDRTILSSKEKSYEGPVETLDAETSAWVKRHIVALGCLSGDSADPPVSVNIGRRFVKIRGDGPAEFRMPVEGAEVQCP